VVNGYLQVEHGSPIDITPLSGLSHNRIWRACFQSTCVIVKQAVETREATFYREAAPQFTAQGVPVPNLEWSHKVDKTEWLVLEHIPKPFPRERWLADADQLRALYRLHRGWLHIDTAGEWWFQPFWDDEMTETALYFFPAESVQNVRPLFTDLQTRSQPLFEAKCWISGDPNPMNWGLRQDDTVVLFDWERFGRGTPALDLAITMPGFPQAGQFETVAARYLHHTEPTLIEIQHFARQIALAKAWNMVEFVYMTQTGNVTDTSRFSYLAEQLPGWLRTIERYTDT
jgi:hypothetical protein